MLASEWQPIPHPLTKPELMTFIAYTPTGRISWRVLCQGNYLLLNSEIAHDGAMITAASGKLFVETRGVWVENTNVPTSIIVRLAFDALIRRHERRAKAAKQKAVAALESIG